MIDQNNITILSIPTHNETLKAEFIGHKSLIQSHHDQTFLMHLMKGKHCQELAYYFFFAIRRLKRL